MRRWRWVWLSLFVLVIGVEVFTAYDGNPLTPPLTHVILRYIPEEIFWAFWGGFAVWFTQHFWMRYRAKR